MITGIAVWRVKPSLKMLFLTRFTYCLVSKLDESNYILLRLHQETLLRSIKTEVMLTGALICLSIYLHVNDVIFLP